jgi:hypothetical protein
VADVPVAHEPCYMTDRKLKPGKHEFELTMLEPYKDHDPFIPFSHLIWY